MNTCEICGASATSWQHDTVEQCEDGRGPGSCADPGEHHDFVPGVISIPPMKRSEALAVGRACRDEAYPPTNIAVLTRAACTLYLSRDLPPDDRKLIANILEWAAEVFRRNG